MENKTKIFLDDHWSRHLIELPETGMGYHLVDVELKDGAILKKKAIINSSFIQLDKGEKLNLNEIKKIRMHR